MDQIKVFALMSSFKVDRHEQNQGFTLVELLVALFIGGIILIAGTSALINLLRANEELESKTTRRANLSRTLKVMENDIRSAKAITQETSGGNCDSGKVSATECLVLTFPIDYSRELNEKCTSNTIEAQVYYGFDDISKGTQTWLKPGVLRRKVFCRDSSGAMVRTNWMVVADGLISVNETQPTTICDQEDLSWTGEMEIYGLDSADKGGFRFCLQENTNDNRLVRVFLYGHIIGGNSNNQIMVNTTIFARGL